MAGKLTARAVESRAKRKGRYSDGDGLFLRVLDPGKRIYWTYRYTLGKERETSIGPYPEMSLADARAKHADLRAMVLNKSDPLAGKRNAAVAPRSSASPPSASWRTIMSPLTKAAGATRSTDGSGPRR